MRAELLLGGCASESPPVTARAGAGGAGAQGLTERAETGGQGRAGAGGLTGRWKGTSRQVLMSQATGPWFLGHKGRPLMI